MILDIPESEACTKAALTFTSNGPADLEACPPPPYSFDGSQSELGSSDTVSRKPGWLKRRRHKGRRYFILASILLNICLILLLVRTARTGLWDRGLWRHRHGMDDVGPFSGHH